MAIASCQTFISVQDLFKEARERGYSYQGEMFSVDNMANLALALIPKNISVQIINGLMENRDIIVHSLAKGAILLVPYPYHAILKTCLTATMVFLLSGSIFPNKFSAMIQTGIMNQVVSKDTKHTGLQFVVRWYAQTDASLLQGRVSPGA